MTPFGCLVRPHHASCPRYTGLLAVRWVAQTCLWACLRPRSRVSVHCQIAGIIQRVEPRTRPEPNSRRLRYPAVTDPRSAVAVRLSIAKVFMPTSMKIPSIEGWRLATAVVGAPGWVRSLLHNPPQGLTALAPPERGIIEPLHALRCSAEAAAHAYPQLILGDDGFGSG